MKQLFKQALALLLVLCVQFSFAQEKTITGTVYDDNSVPLPGATVVVKGSTIGTSTDFDGNYTINANQGATLVFTYVGFTTQEVIVGASNVINVNMAEDATALDEVIVTAYGQTTKEAFTGSADVVGAKDLAVRNVTSPISAIEGRATGVQFTSPAGPGASPGIVIRGVGTLNGSAAPLIILDGAQYSGSLNAINQEDIESFTILKDAASTSLYGSRAAGGVIIITTKKGSKSGTRVSFSAQTGMVTNAVPLYDRLGPGQYYEAMWEALKNSSAGGGDPAFASANIYNQLGYNPFNVPNDQIVGTDGQLNPNAQVIYQSLDWFDTLQRTGVRNNYNVNVSSGGEDHTVFFSASYLDEESYVIRSEFDRITARLNAEFDVSESIKIGGTANIALTEARGPSSGGTGSIVNPFSFAQNIGAIYPVFVNDLNGNLVRDDFGNPIFDNGEGFSEFNIGSRPVNQGRHALQELLLNDERDQDNTYGMRLFTEIKIIDGLKLRVLYSRDINDLVEREYENNLIGDAQPVGRYSQDRARRDLETFNQVLTYTKSFGDHNLDVTVGHESFEWIFSDIGGLATQQAANGIFEFDNFANIVDLDGATNDKAIESYFSRLNYNYDNKYYLSGSVRQDESSVFSPESRKGTFYSVGGSWRIDQEKFMENVSFVDQLKIRSSWGEVGNDRLGGFYVSQPLFSITSAAGSPAVLFTDIGNSDLKWETIETFDIALEFGLFNNFLEGSAEYYKRTTTDLLYLLPIAPSNGLNEVPVNVGDLYNSGLEFGLTAHLFNTADFRWDLNLQASTFKNEITSLPSPVIVGNQRWAEGRSRYDFYLLPTAGVDPANGDQLFFLYELNDDNESVPVLNADGSIQTTNDWTETERVYTGDTSIPDVLGSVLNSVTYKNFSLDVLFTYGIGGSVLDNGYSGLMHAGTYGRSLHPDILRAWRQPGDITDVPRLENGNPDLVRGNSDRFLTDASFLSLKNVNLSYSFGSKVKEAFDIDDLRVSITGENLFLTSERKGLNPQDNLAGSPSANDFSPNRIISLGLNVSF
ncbi:SusC/RagA family TonB-linked outer membrane protein [Winogradskyella sp. A3E31]|uniref:SusC/RagA family TonB-linked outer membrane protein n=1 Tax=Winogradskyella sp. A3E31 TaxID=3349637 RepID=UPI00398A7B1B